jgi:hypothetical protein
MGQNALARAWGARLPHTLDFTYRHAPPGSQVLEFAASSPVGVSTVGADRGGRPRTSACPYAGASPSQGQERSQERRQGQRREGSEEGASRRASKRASGRSRSSMSVVGCLAAGGISRALCLAMWACGVRGLTVHRVRFHELERALAMNHMGCLGPTST